MEVITGSNTPDYDRAKEVEEFDKTKCGVKGLVDSGTVNYKIPRFFHHSPEKLQNSPSNATTNCTDVQIPVIDLQGYENNGPRRKEIVNELRRASETWGIFQMVNHGISTAVLDEVLRGAKRFHEQPNQVKMDLYSRDSERLVRYFCNGDLHASKAASWRDTLLLGFPDGQLDLEILPLVCREAISEYLRCMIDLKNNLAELLSEALGLGSDYLTSLECMKTPSMVCHYYPVCPEPDLTLGARKHSDASFLTILLQDLVGGLQVFHQNRWIDVAPIHGALVTNIGDLIQLITNDKFKSAEHRVLVGGVGPRVSVACFLTPSVRNKFKSYEPIPDNCLPIYRKTHVTEYLSYYMSNGLDGNSALLHFKL